MADATTVTPAWYFDRNVERAIRNGLRQRNVDVIDTDDDRTAKLDDEMLFARATALERIVFTHDDYLSIASRWMREGREHAGIVYVHQLRLGVGEIIDNLEYLSRAHRAEELRNQVIFLPL